MAQTTDVYFTAIGLIFILAAISPAYQATDDPQYVIKDGDKICGLVNIKLKIKAKYEVAASGSKEENLSSDIIIPDNAVVTLLCKPLSDTDGPELTFTWDWPKTPPVDPPADPPTENTVTVQFHGSKSETSIGKVHAEITPSETNIFPSAADPTKKITVDVDILGYSVPKDKSYVCNTPRISKNDKEEVVELSDVHFQVGEELGTTFGEPTTCKEDTPDPGSSTVKPEPPPRVVIGDPESPCILASLDFDITIMYETTGGNKYVHVYVPKTLKQCPGPDDINCYQGTCQGTNVTLGDVDYPGPAVAYIWSNPPVKSNLFGKATPNYDNHAIVQFEKNQKEYYIKNLFFKIKQAYSDINTDDIEFNGTDVKLMKSRIGNSSECNAGETVYSGVNSVHVSGKFELGGGTKDAFSPEEICPADKGEPQSPGFQIDVTAAIAGGVSAGVVVIAAIGGYGTYLCRKRKKSKAYV